MASSATKSQSSRKYGIMHLHVPYDGYLEDEFNILRQLGTDPNELHVTSTDEFKRRIAAACHGRKIAQHAKLLFYGWKEYISEILQLRTEIVNLFLRERILKRRFLAFRIVVTRERLLRKAVRRYCRRSIIIAFYRWRYETRWLIFKQVSRTQVILALRKNLMTQRLMKLNWRTIVQRKRRLEAAKKIQFNFRCHARLRRTKARCTITRFILRFWSYYLFCRRVHIERRRIEFESRAAHSFSNTAAVRLDRLMYQDKAGATMTAQYLKCVKELLKSSGSNRGSGSGNGNGNGNGNVTNNTIIPTDEQLPRISEQWTLDGKILYILQYRCAMEAANIGRRRFREENPPWYWCVYCGEVTVLKRIAEAHSMVCQNAFNYKGYMMRPPKKQRQQQKQQELISRSGVCYGAGFGMGFLESSRSGARVMYDIKVPIPTKLTRTHVVKKSPPKSSKIVWRQTPQQVRDQEWAAQNIWANDLDVSEGLVSISGTRLMKTDKPLPVGAGAVIYVDAGASIAPSMLTNECWVLCEPIVQRVTETLVTAGPSVKFHS